MSDMYLDEIEKIKYYKQKIIEKYLKQGISVNKEKVQEFLDEIDTKIAIFSQAYISSGSSFNAETFNQQKQDIYKDIAILYFVLYQSLQKRIREAEEQIHFIIRSLEEEAAQFQFLVDSKAVAVYGNTIFHQASGFTQQFQDGTLIIPLEKPVQVPSGSYLACLFECPEIDASQVTFVFDEDHVISAYEYDNQYLKIVGPEYSVQTYSYTNEDIVFGKEWIDIEQEIQEENRYNIFLNKDQIRIRNLTNPNTIYARKIQDTYFQTTDKAEISFCVYGASYIHFDIIGPVEYMNFLNGRIDTPKQRQPIIIKTDGNCTFDVKTDGIIYAEQVSAHIENGRLQITGNYNDISDYMVEIINFGSDIVFDNAKVVIKNAQDVLYDIQYIAIKQTQISELENNT